MTDDVDEPRGYTPEEMDLPVGLVKRIRLICSLLHLPVAERNNDPGVALWREGGWKPGELADHVIVAWNVSPALLDAEEAQGSHGPADHLYGAVALLEDGLVDALRRGGLRVERDSYTFEWKVLEVAGTSPLG